MYTIFDYGYMMVDELRTQAYVRALRQAVKPGAVVLDIGTGAGIFALLACQFGARQVYAIEPNDAIQLARELAAANGFSERITFIQDLSTQVTLPKQADVIISDLRGVLPLLQQHIPAIIDARRRFLAPGGILIPQRDQLWAAVVEAPDLFEPYLNPWVDNGYKLNLQAGRQLVTNSWGKGRSAPDGFLVEPHCWATLDYAMIESSNLRAEVTWPVRRSGTAHGLSLWFEATLAEGIGFSTAPDQPELIYGSAFFPWSAPVNLAEGDTVRVTLQANLVGDDYIWRWDSCILAQGQLGQVKANFKQSTFLGVPLSSAQLRKRAAGYVPALNESGQMTRLVLELMDQAMPLQQIADTLADQFPDCFPTRQAALSRVGDLSLKYSR
ncbi:MAG: 50S ribosomal protein L11 methyltransferase [Anaerolineae bacterium]|nr:50S ribosomal protein L11 methyltransferase [Anaerolineae bacterium]MCB0173566.1 50S ribosomal protein L11 methyltransferase [Anaerolineae bacterium]MCB0212806.1 50S ribosomal protein L11 methyltransferase [Anaerolineae bacterium]